MPGWHIADSKVLAVLKETNLTVLDLLHKYWVMTSETGETEQLYYGPCELLENGARKPLLDKPWNSFSKVEQEAFLDSLDVFDVLPESKRAWELPGGDPSTPVRVTFKGFGEWLCVASAGELFGSIRGLVVWVRDTGKEDKLLRKTEESETKTRRTKMQIDWESS